MTDYDTEASRCDLECDDYTDRPISEPESKYGIIGKSKGIRCAAVGCTRTKHPQSKYCAYHKKHRPRSEEAYRRMAERPWAEMDAGKREEQ